MEKIPTAEEFLEDNLSNPTKGWSEKKRLIEFAKLHVEAALKVASQLEETNGTEGYKIYPDSILNSYSLENIK